MTTSAAKSMPLSKVSETTGHPNAQLRSNKKKKKRLSKHVIQAQRDKEEIQLQKQQQELSFPTETTSSPSPKKKKSVRSKDPLDASNYLSTWQDHRDEWKFNKNTQSWLIRHMYESDKINKNSFAVLLEYLKGLQGGSTKARILADATRRAVRYKEYEKNSAQPGANEVEQMKDQEGPDNVPDQEPAADSNVGEDNEAKWRAISDHDKRKEYKRARKALEILRE